MPESDAEGANVDVDLRPGDVVQLLPGPWFGGCLATVTEVKSWGVQCFVAIPHDRERSPNLAFYRAVKGSYRKVGRAKWDISEDDAVVEEG